MPIHAEKICDMCSLLEMQKMRQCEKYVAIAYSHKMDMPILQAFNDPFSGTTWVSQYQKSKTGFK